jgi:hypothetical protein
MVGFFMFKKLDSDRLKRMCELVLESRDVIISEFTAIPTQKFDEKKNKWVPDSYSLFLMLKRKVEPNLEKVGGDITYKSLSSEFAGIEVLLEGLLGFECCVDFV